MRRQNVDLQPDGIDQSCNSDTIWRDLVGGGGGGWGWAGGTFAALFSLILR